MPECILCDSENFDIIDGLYFCTQCGTQSQDLQEESAFHDEIVDRRLHIQKKVKVKKQIDRGQPWFTLEGFQVVIKAQVEFLVKKGVNAKLKDIVGQMWFRYVELSSETFQTTDECESDDVCQTYFELQKRRDNIMVERIANPQVDSSYRQSVKSAKKKQQEDMDTLELSSEIAREDFYEDDDPTRVLFDIDDEQDSVSDDSHAGSINCAIRKSKKSAGYMNMTNTISFCYLGLLWLCEPICLSDLIRWAREGHLPFFNASSLFPSYMKFSKSDVLTFSGRVLPSKRKVYCSSSALKAYICLPDLAEQDIGLYIARYLIDLQLPACVHRCVYNVVNMVKMNYNKLGHLRNYDELAMAYIVLTLKLIYGLDGKTEGELAKLVEEIPPDSNGSYFPTWSDVLEVVYTCQKGLLCHGVPWTIEELGLLKDSRDYGQFCRESIFGSWKPRLTVDMRNTHYTTGWKGLSTDKQEEYARTFERFLDDDGQDERPVNLRDASSFPLLSGEREWAKQREKSEVTTWCNRGKLDSDGFHGEIPGEAIAKDKLVFITENQRERNTSSSRTASNSLKQAKRRGLSWETISDYYQSENGEESVSTAESASSCSLPSNTRPNKRPRSSSSDSAPSKCRTPYVCYNLPSCTYTIPPKSMIHWNHSWKDAVLPDSLRHLVELCGKVVETEPSVLFNIVQEMEKTLFDEDV